METGLGFEWFRRRTYRHFDRPVAETFLARVLDPAHVAQHSFSPLLSRPTEVKRYKPALHKTKPKVRPIMYASHRDTAIFSWYSHQLSERLESYYANSGLEQSVVAYRALGKANYHFAAEAHRYAVKSAPCTILAFDVTGFFDNLSHARLKTRLKALLGVHELPADWFAVFRAVTKFRFVELEALSQHPSLAARFSAGANGPIATVSELKSLGVPFLENGAHLVPPRGPNGSGIPQGTSISAVLSNVYMMAFDAAMQSFCNKIGALYRRYSDDILVICHSSHQSDVESTVKDLLDTEQLQLSAAKTEITAFDLATAPGGKAAQYLGFSFYPGGAGLRPSSLSRTWRRMREAVRAAKIAAAKSGRPLKTKKLYKRFATVFDPTQARYLRNFSAYARRSADQFNDGEKISRQLKRLQRGLSRQIEAAKKDLT